MEFLQWNVIYPLLPHPAVCGGGENHPHFKINYANQQHSMTDRIYHKKNKFKEPSKCRRLQICFLSLKKPIESLKKSGLFFLLMTILSQSFFTLMS